MIAEATEPPELPAQLTVSQALKIALSNGIDIRSAVTQLEQATGQYEQSARCVSGNSERDSELL